jgi:hypothetical protein
MIRGPGGRNPERTVQRPVGTRPIDGHAQCRCRCRRRCRCSSEVRRARTAMRKLRLSSGSHASEEDDGWWSSASCSNESESRHCSVNRTLHQPPAGESIDGLIMEMNMGWSRRRLRPVYRPSSSLPLMHACVLRRRRVGELARGAVARARMWTRAL